MDDQVPSNGSDTFIRISSMQQKRKMELAKQMDERIFAIQKKKLDNNDRALSSKKTLFNESDYVSGYIL